MDPIRVPVSSRRRQNRRQQNRDPNISLLKPSSLPELCVLPLMPTDNDSSCQLFHFSPGGTRDLHWIRPPGGAGCCRVLSVAAWRGPLCSLGAVGDLDTADVQPGSWFQLNTDLQELWKFLVHRLNLDRGRWVTAAITTNKPEEPS